MKALSLGVAQTLSWRFINIRINQYPPTVVTVQLGEGGGGGQDLDLDLDLDPGPRINLHLGTPCCMLSHVSFAQIVRSPFQAQHS